MRPRPPRNRWSRFVLLALLAVVVGCGSTPPRPIRPAEDVYDPDPARRVAAVQAIRQSGDRARVPDLIELLDDRDEAVRLAAGVTLRDLTGRDSGYRAWAEPAERRDQVEDWRRWWASQSPVARAGADADEVGS